MIWLQIWNYQLIEELIVVKSIQYGELLELLELIMIRVIVRSGFKKVGWC